jgi:hypothetical protein
MGQGSTHLLRQPVCRGSKVSVPVFERLVRLKARDETTLGVSEKDSMRVSGIVRVHPETCHSVQGRREKSHSDHAQQTARFVFEHVHHRDHNAAVRFRKPSVQLGIVKVRPQRFGGEAMVPQRRRKGRVIRGVLSGGSGARKGRRPKNIGTRSPRTDVDD